MTAAEPVGSTIRVSVAESEFGCCGTVPATGAELSGTLSAYPLGDVGDSWRAVPVLGWDTEDGLVRTGSVSAYLSPHCGDPLSVPLALGLSWHTDHDRAPAVRGIVEAVWTTSHCVRRVRGQYVAVPGTETRCQVMRAGDDPRWDESGCEASRCDEPSDPHWTRVHGATVVDLRITGYTPPRSRTPRPTESMRRRISLSDEVVDVIGPPVAFGSGVPAVGARVILDLDDERLTVPGIAEPRGRLDGTVVDVRAAREIGGGWVMDSDAPPSGPGALLCVSVRQLPDDDRDDR
ncbi:MULTISPECIES: hypothetical protein [unclassified Gordonia (in: high G+C Gram-positive bacteria)]